MALFGKKPPPAPQNVQSAIRIEGLKSFRRDLSSVNKKAIPLIGKALKSSAEEVRQSTASDSQTPRRSGALISSLKAGASIYGNRAGPRAYITSKLFYAKIIHDGATIERGPAGWVRGPHTIRIAPNPFISRNIEKNEESIVDLVTAALDDVINIAAGRTGSNLIGDTE